MTSGPPPNDLPPLDPATAAESNTEWLLGVMGMFCFVAISVVLLRMYTRFKLARAAGSDDYVMMAAALASLGGMVCFAIQGAYGLGKHRQVIDDDDFLMFSKVGFFQGLISDTGAMALLKISIALSLLRLSRNRWYSYALWGLIAFVVSYLIVAWCSCIFWCKPISGFWDKRDGPQCYDIKIFIMFALLNTGCNLFTDVAFATLPIPIIWVLQMKLRTRVYLIAILSLGYIAVAMGIVKAVYQISFGGSKNDQFLRPIHFWGFLQLNVGIIAACAPTLKPLVGRMLKLSSSNGNSGTGYYADGSAGPRNRRHTGGYAPQSNPAGDFELDARPFGGDGGPGPMYRANVRGGKNSRGPDDKDSDTGSEEMILQGQIQDKGIMRTTEIAIHR